MKHVRHRTAVSYLTTPLSIILLVVGIFGTIWLRSGIITLEYSISELENRKMESLRQAKSLMAEKASLLSMYKIDTKGVRNLGLVFPDRKKIVYVREAGSGPQKAFYERQGDGSREGRDRGEPLHGVYARSVPASGEVR